MELIFPKLRTSSNGIKVVLIHLGLTSTVTRSTKHPTCEAACLFYYGSDTAFVEGTETNSQLREQLAALIGDAVVVAQTAGFDVLNAWTLMDR